MILPPWGKCPMCGVYLTDETIGRWKDSGSTEKDGTIRKDVLGRPWCQGCQDKHDDIDWDEVAERRLGQK